MLDGEGSVGLEAVLALEQRLGEGELGLGGLGGCVLHDVRQARVHRRETREVSPGEEGQHRRFELGAERRAGVDGEGRLGFVLEVEGRQ